MSAPPHVVWMKRLGSFDYRLVHSSEEEAIYKRNIIETASSEDAMGVRQWEQTWVVPMEILDDYVRLLEENNRLFTGLKSALKKLRRICGVLDSKKNS